MTRQPALAERFSRMKTLIIAATLVTAALASGCSSNTTQDPVPTPGTKTETPAPAPTTPADTAPGGTTTPPAVTPKAPTIDGIMKMAGALHVMWTNPTPACDTIEGERQATMADGSIMEKYKVVFTVPGEADNKHDTTATDAMTYSYRLRCKKGGTYSAYSNEMTGKPK
jgi:hypothetical protein